MPHILGEQQQQEEPTTTKETLDEQQKRDGLQAEIEKLNRQLQEKELQAVQEIQSLKQQVQDKEAQLACMASWEIEALQCRKPTKSYAVYLKDQWLQFQINTLAQRGITPFQNYYQFSTLCGSSSSEDRAKLSKFYLQNLALPNMNAWDPNTVIGDV